MSHLSTVWLEHVGIIPMVAALFRDVLQLLDMGPTRRGESLG